MINKQLNISYYMYIKGDKYILYMYMQGAKYVLST